MSDRNVFTISFSGVAVSAAQDLFEVTAAAGYRLELIDVRFGQISDVGDAAAEQLGVNIRLGAASGSGGSAVTPVAVNALGRNPTSVAERNNTTPGSGGYVLVSDVFNIAAPYLYRPGEAERIVTEPGGRLSVGVTAPADALTMYGTLTFAEIAL